MLTDEELTRLITCSYGDEVSHSTRAEITRRANTYLRHRRMTQSGLAAMTAAVVAAFVLTATTVGAARDSDNHTHPTSSASPSGQLDLKSQEKRCFDQLTHPPGSTTIPRDPVAGHPIRATPPTTAPHYAGPYTPLFVLAHGGGPRWLFYFDDKDRFSTTYFCDGSGAVVVGGGADKRYNAILSGVPYPPAPPVPFRDTGKQRDYPGFVTGFVPADAQTVSVTMPNGGGTYPGQVSQGVFVVWVAGINRYGMTLTAKSETHVYTIRSGHMTTARR
jgi:hypothetical protein